MVTITFYRRNKGLNKAIKNYLQGLNIAHFIHPFQPTKITQFFLNFFEIRLPGWFLVMYFYKLDKCFII